MFVRGDISILIPDLFRCVVAILTAPAVVDSSLVPVGLLLGDGLEDSPIHVVLELSVEFCYPPLLYCSNGVSILLMQPLAWQ